MSVLQCNNMFLNLPKELWGSMVTLSTLETFCSCWKTFYQMKDIFARELLLKHVGLILPLEEEVYLLSKGLTFYRFMCLLENKTQFHRIAPFIGKYNVKETPAPVLTNIIIPSLGVKGSLRFCVSQFASRKLGDGYRAVFSRDLPKVTFLLNKDFDTKVTFHVPIKSHDYCVIDTLSDYCCLAKGQIVGKCLLYARNMVLDQKSADCLIPLIQHNFPVLEEVPFYSRSENESKFLNFLLNNTAVIELYFDVLMNPEKDVPYNNNSKFWFLYYSVFHDDSSLAYKTYLLFRGVIPKDAWDIIGDLYRMLNYISYYELSEQLFDGDIDIYTR